MKFGPVDIAETDTLIGAVLAHSAELADGKRLKKGTLLGNREIEALAAAGKKSVIVARPEKNDVLEDEAARQIASQMDGPGIRVDGAATGRVNLHAKHDGILVFDTGAVLDLNRVDPAITMATLAPFSRVLSGQMVATVKMIAFAANAKKVDEASSHAASVGLTVRPFKQGLRIGLIQTQLPTIKTSVLDKTRRVTDERLSAFGAKIGKEIRIQHDAEELSFEISTCVGNSDLVIVFGASAVCDPGDVIPAAIRSAGGSVETVGMPVDPGNLIVIGKVGACTVIGAPGCARSAKLNGFDWVLERICAGVEVTREDIITMAVGGLLMEIPSRPQPRERGA